MIFTDKVALVTGAGGGIGTSISLVMASRGASVAVVDIALGRAQETVDQIVAAGGRAVAIETDLAQPAQVERMIVTTVTAFGRLDILVNNANEGRPQHWQADQDFLTVTPETFDAYNAIGSRAVFIAIQKAVPEMRRLGGGAIVNIASMAGMRGLMTLAAYGASKGAMIALTRHVATVFGKDNIRCNAVAPGLTLHKRLLAKMPAAAQMPKDTILLNEFPQAEDIAEAVAFLASDAARCITGQLLPVDSGTTAGFWHADRRTN